MNYSEFLNSKAAVDIPTGFEPQGIKLNRPAFGFQRDVVNWSARRGRAALFEDCGLGKTVQQLAWAAEVVPHAERVLILAPLAVADQTIKEGEIIGVDVKRAAGKEDIDGPGIYITNYAKLHRFDPTVFGAVVLDESSILKSYDGATRKLINESFKHCACKLACTATPAPNDYMELGNHAEFLGVMTREEMLAMFFTHDGGETSKWRLKGHAEDEFWKWLCSWAVNIRQPSDLGYDDGAFKLPDLKLHEHIVESGQAMDGYLFALPASTLAERRDARRASLPERVELAASLILSSILCGKQNTPSLGAKSITQTSHTESAENLMRELLLKTKNTCKSITLKIKRSGKGAKSNKQKSTQTEGLDTQQTQNIGLTQSEKSPITSSEIQGKGSLSESENTDSRLSNMSPCSNLKKEDAQSAIKANSKAIINSHSSITVTEQNTQGESSVSAAITDSGNSKTALDCYDPQSDTWKSTALWIVWCNLDCEQRALEKAFGDLCFSIYGGLEDEEKEFRLNRWINLERPILIGKPSMMGYGLNLQVCSNMAFVGLSDSYEQYYQAIRRCWRFGQTREVNAHLVISNLEGAVLANLKRKDADATRMAKQMVKHMAAISSKEIRGVKRNQASYEAKKQIEIPQWLTA